MTCLSKQHSPVSTRQHQQLRVLPPDSRNGSRKDLLWDSLFLRHANIFKARKHHRHLRLGVLPAGCSFYTFHVHRASFNLPLFGIFFRTTGPNKLKDYSKRMYPRSLLFAFFSSSRSSFKGKSILYLTRKLLLQELFETRVHHAHCSGDIIKQ